jgi:hypothetical protein
LHFKNKYALNRTVSRFVKQLIFINSLFFVVLGLIFFCGCEKQQVYYYGNTTISNLLSQDSLSFSISLDSKPYDQNYQDTLQLSGKCVLEGKAEFFTDFVAITLFQSHKELLSSNHQIDIICKIDHQEKYFYYTDKFQNIPNLLKNLSTKYAISNNEMYVKCYRSGYVVKAMANTHQIAIETIIKVNKQVVNKQFPILIEEREYHKNDFPGAK